MKKVLAIVLALAMVFSFAACGKKEETPQVTADKDYVIRVYSNTNDESEVQWLKENAEKAGFKISIDDNTVISGDLAVVQAANEGKDGDVLFGLNETRWGQVINGSYENLKLVEWEPTWSGKVGTFKYDKKAYGVTIQNVLMLYRTDEFGTNGKALKFDHWSEMADQGLVYYRQGKVGGTTNGNINNCMLFPYADPTSPAGGVSVDGWKALWKYCAGGTFTGDSYGFDPLNACKVQLSTFYSSSLYGSVDTAASGSEHPLTYDAAKKAPGNWALVDIKDGSYFIAEYIGVLEKAERTEAQTAQVKAFCEWFGSTETQTGWANEFDRYPCNTAAAEASDLVDYAGIYSLHNMAQDKVGDKLYYEYVAEHSAEWTNIMTNLGFFWKDADGTHTEPDWDNLDWATLCKPAQ